MRLGTVVLCMHLVHAALNMSSLQQLQNEDYTMYDALKHAQNVVFYPIDSLEAVQLWRAYSTFGPQLPSNGQQKVCCTCTMSMNVIDGPLVSPHDGIHWMHAICYFKQLYWYAMKDGRFTCPSCQAIIDDPCPTILHTEYSRYNSKDTSKNALPQAPVLFAVYTDCVQSKEACAFLEQTLIVCRNLVSLRAICNWRNNILEVVIDLTGLVDPEAIIMCIIRKTKNALMLDIYTATLIPPSQNIEANQALYMKCLDSLKTYKDHTLSTTEKAIVYLVVTRLTMDDMCSSMPKILVALGIVKQPMAARMEGGDQYGATTKAISGYEIGAAVKDSNQSYGKNITAVGVKQEAHIDQDRPSLGREVLYNSSSNGHHATRGASTSREPKCQMDVKTREHSIAVAVRAVTSTETTCSEPTAAEFFFQQGRSFMPLPVLKGDKTSLFVRLFLWLTQHGLLASACIVFHVQTFPTALSVMKSLDEVYRKNERILSIADKVIMREIIDKMMMLARVEPFIRRIDRNIVSQMFRIPNNVFLV